MRQAIQVTPPLPSAEERGWIVDGVSRELNVDPGPLRAQLVQATTGVELQQLRSLLIEAHFKAPEQGFSLPIVQTLKDGIIKQSEIIEVEDPQWGFESVGGYAPVKTFIRETVIAPLQQVERANRFGTNLPRGLLLFGPPGTGKTLFAKALAKETYLPFINLKTENLFSQYLGETGHRLSSVIRLIDQMSPAVVFIDELDRLGQRNTGSDGASQETRRAFGQMLEWMGNSQRRCLFVCTTNTLEHLDEAMVRMGRFDYKIPFLWPNREGRLEILAIHLGVHPNSRISPPPLAISQERLNPVLHEIAARTENFSGAELEQLVMRARRRAFNDLSREHLVEEDLLTALEGLRIPQEVRRQQKRHYLAQAQQHTDDVAFLESLQSELNGETI